MNRIALIGLLVVAGCASVPPSAPPSPQLFRDDRFTSSRPDTSRARIFAASDELRRFLQNDIAAELRNKGKQVGLIDSLYRGELRIDYDAGTTRNAAETFARRSGNCLSLAVLTGTVAQELGLTVHYQSVVTDETWGRGDGLYYSIGHVNVVIGSRTQGSRGLADDDTVSHTIDFMPGSVLRATRTRPISEDRIAAMFMNNRAAESLLDGKIDDAYWWARQAALEDPVYAQSFNALGVIYRRIGHLEDAERALRHALQQDPDNVHAMSNLALVLSDAGRPLEAQPLLARVERLQFHPPFFHFERGREAYDRGDIKLARTYFQREIDRNRYSAETHFWLAATYLRDGDFARAREELERAIEYGATKQDRELYAAKLQKVKSYIR